MQGKIEIKDERLLSQTARYIDAFSTSMVSIYKDRQYIYSYLEAVNAPVNSIREFIDKHLLPVLKTRRASQPKCIRELIC